MTGPAGRFGRRDAGLTVFALTGAATFAWGYGTPRAWALLPAFVSAAAFRIPALPAWLCRAVERLGWLVTGLLAADVFHWLAWPEGQSQIAPPLPFGVAYGAPLLAALFLSGREIWSPHRTLVPAVLVMAVLGASRARGARPMEAAVAGLTLSVVLLFQSDAGRGPASALRQRLARLGAFVLVAGAIAVGIARFLPWAQPLVVGAASRAAFPPDAAAGFSQEARLGVSEELRLTTEVAMHVECDAPRKLRGWVATGFDGSTWSTAVPPVTSVAGGAELPPSELAEWVAGIPGDTFLVRPGDPGLDGGGSLARTTIELIGYVPGHMPAPQGVAVARAPIHQLLVDRSGLLGPALPPGVVYRLVSGLPEVGAEPGPEFLAVPEPLDPRMADLADTLAAGTTSTRERIDRTTEYLREHLAYSLKMGPFHSRQPLAEFVFEKKMGWCQYFASAGAVLLRRQGVATRYVSGFQLRDRLLRGGHYVVRLSDAHAWIEAWVPGHGWVEADPTPASGYDRAHGGPDSDWLEGLRSLGARVRALDWKAVPRLFWALEAAAAGFGWRRGVALGAGALAVAAVVWTWRRAGSARGRGALPSGPGLELAPLLGRLDEAWLELGVPRPPSRAPLEHLSQIPPGRVPGPLVPVSREIVERYYRVRFAGDVVQAAEIPALEAALERALMTPPSTGPQ